MSAGPKTKYVAWDEQLQERSRRGQIAFGEVIRQIRDDMNHLQNLLDALIQKMKNESEMHQETRNWVYDIFLDKTYETHAKIKQLTESVGLPWGEIRPPLETALGRLKQQCELAMDGWDFMDSPSALAGALENYQRQVESILSGIRRSLHETGWITAANLSSIDYVVEHRKKFVSAREELEKAKRAIASKDWEEVANHVRTAIELGIKEKFGFTNIRRMIDFLGEAEDKDFPLPSYSTVYYYYNVGSRRLHSGVINTPLEAKQAVSFVAQFLDELDLSSFDDDKIEAFKKTSKTVE